MCLQEGGRICTSGRDDKRRKGERATQVSPSTTTNISLPLKDELRSPARGKGARYAEPWKKAFSKVD